MTAALLLMAASLGAEFAWPTWVSGINSAEYAELSLAEYEDFYYTGPIKVRCGYSGVRRMPPYGTYWTVPCDGFTSLSNSSWITCAGEDNSCRTDYIFPVVVLQISMKDVIAGIIRASIVWDYPGESLPCSGPSGKPKAPCTPLTPPEGETEAEPPAPPWHGSYDADGPFEGIPSPNLEGCLPSDFAMYAVEAAIETNELCQLFAGFYLQGLRYIVIEHGSDYCETWFPLEDFNCDGFWGDVDGEGGSGGTGEGEDEGGLDPVPGGDWRSVIWDPIDQTCGADFPVAEKDWAIPVGGVNALYVRPDGSIPNEDDELATAPVLLPRDGVASTQPQYYLEQVSGCRSYLGTNIPVPFGAAAHPFQSQAVFANNSESQKVRVYPEGLGDSPDMTFPGQPAHQDDPNIAAPVQGIPVGVFFGIFFGGDVQLDVPHNSPFQNLQASKPNSVVTSVGNVHDVRSLCKPGEFVDYDLNIPEGGEACSWKANDGTLLGYRTRAQKTRVSPVKGNYTGSTVPAGVLGEKFYWVQRVKYPAMSEGAYEGYRIHLDQDERSGPIGGPPTMYEEDNEVFHNQSSGTGGSGNDGWFRLQGPVGVAQPLGGDNDGATGANGLAFQYQIAPQPYPEGFGVGGGSGSSSGGRPWWEADGGEVIEGPPANQGMPVNTNSMARAVAEGTAVGIGTAANTLASKIASAVTTGLANAQREQQDDELTFDAPSEVDTGYEESEDEAAQRSFGPIVTGAQLMVDTGLPNRVETIYNRYQLVMQGSASYAPVFSITVPFFGEDRVFHLDFRGGEDGSVLANGVATWRLFLRAIVLFAFLVYFLWNWAIPLLFGGWPWSASSSEVTR